MPSLSELWDESKYSEGDPVRQLITASKAVKDWPMDTLNWGNGLVDMTTGGLNKIFPRIPKTHLANEIPHAIYGDKYDSPSLSEYPAQDVKDGRSLGRMLNPALLFSGNQRVLTPKMGEFNTGRRAVLVGNPVDNPDNLSTVVDTLKNKSMTRRDFNKGLVTGAASIAAGPLLSKFSKTVEKLPEAGQLAKNVSTTEVGTSKYNSLKDYMDAIAEQANGSNSFGYGNTPAEISRELLKMDEFMYRQAKQNSRDGLNPTPYEIQYSPTGETTSISWDNAFSQKAKEEMRAFKKHLKDIDYSYPEVHPFESRSDIMDAYKNWSNPTKFDTDIPPNSGNRIFKP